MKPNQKSLEIIKKFKLSPHPEGGWFREIVRSKNSLIREDGQSRNFITGIYYLLEENSKSAWHRLKMQMKFGFISGEILLIYGA